VIGPTGLKPSSQGVDRGRAVAAPAGLAVISTAGQFAEINEINGGETGCREVEMHDRWLGCVPILCFFYSTNANFGCWDAIRAVCSAFINFSLS
jgi:hypothetical protein